MKPNRTEFPLYALLFLLGIYIYSAIHELLHFFAAYTFGYPATIKWDLFVPVTSLNIGTLPPLGQYMTIVLAPYLFGILLLALFLALYFTLKKKPKVLLFLSIFPLLDLLINLATIKLAPLINKPNDFLNLFKIGGLYGITGHITLLVLGLIVINILLFILFIREMKGK